MGMRERLLAYACDHLMLEPVLRTQHECVADECQGEQRVNHRHAPMMKPFNVKATSM